MPYYPDQHHRRTIRIPGYDYSTPGAYFLTLCVEGRRCLLSEVTGDHVLLTKPGEIVAECWASLPERFPSVRLDTSVIMPNHFHATIFLVGVRFIAPTARAAHGYANRAASSVSSHGHQDADGAGAINRAPTGLVTLGEVVRAFKGVSARRIRVEADPGFAWQRNYFERVLRDEERLMRARRYVDENPARWLEDPERPR